VQISDVRHVNKYNIITKFYKKINRKKLMDQFLTID